MSVDILTVISGEMGSGKSTLANGLKEEFGFHVISIGTTIKKVSQLLVDDNEILREYLLETLKEEEKFEEIFTRLIQEFEVRFNNADWRKSGNGEYIKNSSYRDLTQFVATYFRELYGEDIWVRFVASDAMELADKGEKVICDDLRFPNEKKIFEMFGFSTIRLDISKEEKLRRLQREYGEIPEDLLNHPSETALNDAFFDFRIPVDGLGKDELKNRVCDFLKLSNVKSKG